MEVYNPYDRSKIAQLNLDDEAEVSKKWDLCSNTKIELSPYRRIEILEKLHNILQNKKEKLIETAIAEGGKPYNDTKVEIQRGLEGIKIAIREIPQLTGQQVPMSLNKSSTERLAITIKKPRGPVFSISAFNHPFNLIIHQVIPAIAAACPVLIKPAPATPLSCQLIIQALYEAGLEPELCQMTYCSNQAAQKIVTNPKLSFLSFIGSAKVGWMLRSLLPPGADCTLEHGGSAPVIIDPTADLSKAIPAIIKGAFYHAGQVCVSVQRVFVHQDLLSDFSHEIVKQAQSLTLGDPKNLNCEVGPLIEPQEVNRVHEWVQKSQGKVLCGGQKVKQTAYLPTVVLNPAENSELSQAEVFGPVLCLYSYNDRDEAIKRANQVPFCFQAAVFTQNLDSAWEFSSKLSAMAVMINDHSAFRTDWMPFGGAKESGLGCGGIGYSMQELCHEKLLVFKSSVFGS